MFGAQWKARYTGQAVWRAMVPRPAQVKARHAYYGMISYIDDKIGRIMQTLRDAALDQDTIVVFLGDHGEMMGERGMWFKSTFFEWSSRVPLIVRWPGRYAPRRVPTVVSLVAYEEDGGYEVLREGALPSSALEAMLR